MKNWLFYIAVQASLLTFCGTLAHANLIVNGTFEDPLLTPGTFQLFTLGSGIGAGANWTVIGAPGDVAVVSTTYHAPVFPAQEQLNWLDLTGASATVTGVQQVVPTVLGVTYDLSFWVGNQTIFGISSTVNILLNGTPSFVAANSLASSNQNWQLFTYQFTATSASTAIGFLNGDPAGDQSNGLDNVQIVVSSNAAVPEPASVFICGGGLIFLGAIFRRRLRTVRVL